MHVAKTCMACYTKYNAVDMKQAGKANTQLESELAVSSCMEVGGEMKSNNINEVFEWW